MTEFDDDDILAIGSGPSIFRSDAVDLAFTLYRSAKAERHKAGQLLLHYLRIVPPSHICELCGDGLGEDYFSWVECNSFGIGVALCEPCARWCNSKPIKTVRRVIERGHE